MKKRYLLAGFLFNTIGLYAQQPVVAGYLGSFDGQFAPVMINNQKQWLHSSGAVLVDRTENFGLYHTVVAVKHNAYGAINREGKIIAPFKFDDISLAEEEDDKDTTKNYCLVITRLNGKFGAVDTLGNVICEPVYSDISVLTPRMARVKKDGRWGWIAIKNGQVIQAPLYEDADKSYARDNAIQIKKAGKVGLAAEDGSIIVPPEYESFEYLSNKQRQYFGFTQQGKSGVMDFTGKKVIPAIYNECRQGPGDDLFVVTLNGKKGFVNAQGKELLPPQYTAVSEMGRSTKVSIDKKCGVVNSAGKEIIPVKYDDIQAMNGAGQEVFSGVVSLGAGALDPEAPVCYIIKDQGKIALFDPNGKQVSPFIYTVLTPFTLHEQPYLAAAQGNKAGLLRPDGKVVVPLEYDGIAAGSISGYSYLDEEAGNDKKDYLPVIKGERMGLYNMAAGKELLPPLYDWIQWQKGQLLYLRNGDTSSIADNTGKIIRGGKQYGFFTVVANNRIVETQYLKDGTTLCMLTDLSGRTLYTKPHWEFKESSFSRLLVPEEDRRSIHAQFSNGLLKLWGDPRENVFLDEEGKEVIFEDYSFVGDFWNDLALAGKETTPGHLVYGIIKRNKEIVYPITADDFNALNDFLIVKKGELKGLIRKDGAIVLPVNYESVDVYNSTFLKVSQHGKYGITDAHGKMILPAEFDDISYREDQQLFKLTKGDKEGFADASGKIFIPVIYDDVTNNRGYDRNIFPLLVKEGKYYFYLDREGKPLPYRALKEKGYND